MGFQRAAVFAQIALRALYPPQCLTCGAGVAEEFRLCPDCWRDTPFISGLVCDACGRPLPGDEEEGQGEAGVHCDDCLAHPPPWARGRAALIYGANARRLVLGLKHGDRMDCAGAAGTWMARAGRAILDPGLLVAPVPLHWSRLFKRRYNQSALLGRAVARAAGLEFCPDLLVRPRRTPSQEGRDREGRLANLDGALAVHPRRRSRIAGRALLLVDDVLTSGATLAAATRAAQAAGAGPVSVLVLARVAKDA